MSAIQEQLEPVFRRMGEPSWLILGVLDPVAGRPGVEIIRQVEDLFNRVNYPTQHLDPSTLHYALKRMEEDGLVRCDGRRLVEVPGPHGTTRPEQRSIYVITPLGVAALECRHALNREVQQRSAGYGRLKPALG